VTYKDNLQQLKEMQETQDAIHIEGEVGMACFVQAAA